MKPLWRTVLVILLITGVTGGIVYETFFDGENNTFDTPQNVASSKMTYGRFLEYLDMGWVKKVDLYDNSKIAIIEASSPELGNRPQRIRVEIPTGASQLIVKLRQGKIDFDSHPVSNNNFTFEILGNLLLPILFVSSFLLISKGTQRRTLSNPDSASTLQIE